MSAHCGATDAASRRVASRRGKREPRPARTGSLAVLETVCIGPGTSYAADGQFDEMTRKRQFPIVGRGTGHFSFVHIEDDAAAAVAALERGQAGVYNVVDDEPAEMREWLPAYAESVGAKPPRRVPRWLARIVANRFMADSAVELRGASNGTARSELGWQPRLTSWREGFHDTPDAQLAALTQLPTGPGERQLGWGERGEGLLERGRRGFSRWWR